MADTSAATGLTVQQWDDKFYKDWIQSNRFAKYMGTSPGALIQVKEDLTKKKGDTITFALVNRLTNAAVEGSNTLEGNEEDMISRSHTVTVNKKRNAVRVSEMEEQKSAIGLRAAARPVLMDWAMEYTRDRVIRALGMINGVAYASATEAQKDAWLDDNYDRVLFGSAKSNTDSTGGTVAYDFSDSLANIDNTSDKLSAANISLLKRIAQTASPKIRPIRTEGDKEFFVMFAHPLCFRDLKNDSVITQAQRDVGLRMQNNRLFQGGDIEWDGVIIREIQDIATLSNVGAGAAVDVGPNYFCGAQALAMANAKRWRTKTKEFDYGDKFGVAIDGIWEINKMIFGTGAGDTDDQKDHGVVTGFFAAVADA